MTIGDDTKQNVGLASYCELALIVHITEYTYSTVQYSTVQYSTVQFSTVVQYSSVQYSTVQYRTVVLYLLKSLVQLCKSCIIYTHTQYNIDIHSII